MLWHSTHPQCIARLAFGAVPKSTFNMADTKLNICESVISILFCSACATKFNRASPDSLSFHSMSYSCSLEPLITVKADKVPLLAGGSEVVESLLINTQLKKSLLAD